MRILGLMSGTSFDAVDAAIVDFTGSNGDLVGRVVWSDTVALDPTLRRRLAQVLPPAQITLQEITALDSDVGQLFARVAHTAQVESGGFDAVCSHGQTVYHWVEDGVAKGTLQIGSAAWIAQACGVPVVSNFRIRDITVGGQGAPLVPLLDRLLLASKGPGVRAALNLGGIANITVVTTGTGGSADGTGNDSAYYSAHDSATDSAHDSGNDSESDSADAAHITQTLVAYDVGPAGALTDAVVQSQNLTAQGYDVDGRLAAAGTVDQELLTELLEDPYYRLAPPKSTGKEYFSLDYVLDKARGLVTQGRWADLIATLTELTVLTVSQAVQKSNATYLAVSGGGAHNPVTMAGLRRELPGVEVVAASDLGAPIDDKEAILCALIGWCTLHGVPAGIPAATGAKTASILGDITPGASPLILPAPVKGLRSLTLEGPTEAAVRN